MGKLYNYLYNNNNFGEDGAIQLIYAMDNFKGTLKQTPHRHPIPISELDVVNEKIEKFIGPGLGLRRLENKLDEGNINPIYFDAILTSYNKLGRELGELQKVVN